MRQVSIRELHTRASELVRAAADGERIVIERRGEPVAELGPLTTRKRRPGLREMARFRNHGCPATADDFWKKIADMYLDSVRIAKFYVNERDSEAVRKVIRSGAGFVSSAWALNEVV
jgi:prevent-host-death family protein